MLLSFILLHPDEIIRMKQSDGGIIGIFGSGTIVQQLVHAGLIDEFLIVVTPIILGKGKLLFKDVRELNLDLLEATDFISRNVLMHYKLKN